MKHFYKHLLKSDLEAAVGAGRPAIGDKKSQDATTAGLHLPASAEGPAKESPKRARHSALVDKKFRSSLTEAEQAELTLLQADLDEAESKLYAPIERKLELALTKLRQRPRVR